jgi:hypothetical protein
MKQIGIGLAGLGTVGTGVYIRARSQTRARLAKTEKLNDNP